MRLIDADAFIEDIKTEIMNLYLDGMKGTPRPKSELYDIIDRIGEQPTVDDAIVLPCKVGDTVYQADQIRIYPITIKKLIYDAGHIDFDEEAIGKSVFLTREEAEAALAKMGGEKDG